MYALEIFGAIFSILGAWQMSYAQKEYLYKAFILFFLSNSALLLFFLINGKPMNYGSLLTRNGGVQGAPVNF